MRNIRGEIPGGGTVLVGELSRKELSGGIVLGGIHLGPVKISNGVYQGEGLGANTQPPPEGGSADGYFRLSVRFGQCCLIS